jgi:hypothetical protein
MTRTLLALLAATVLGVVVWLLWSDARTADTAKPASARMVAAEAAPEPVPATEREPAVEPALAPPDRTDAPVAAAVAREIGFDELRGPELPPGTIEARVLQGTEPLRVPVELGRYAAPIITSEALAGPREALERKSTDERGAALFAGLEPGSYALRAELEDGSSLAAHATLEEGATHGERVWLLFGAGGIRGRVFAADGAPRPDELIAVSAWRKSMRREVRTAWDGAYAVGGLRSGDYSVILLDEADGRITEEASVHVVLAPGEWKTVDLGSSSGLVRWRGTLRLSDGQPATGPDQIELRDIARGGSSVLQFGADGRIDAEVAPGRYAVRTWSLGDPLELGEIGIEPGLSELDLVLPGTELTGVVRFAEGELLPGEDRAARFTQVWVKSVAAPERKGFASTDEAGRYVFRALGAGDWRVTIYPGAISEAPLEGLVVRIVDGTARVVLDLERVAVP